MQAEWVILTVVVVVLVSKLVSVLGRDEPKTEKWRFVAPQTGQVLEMTLLSQKRDNEGNTVKEDLFNEDDFLMGAKMAFNAVVDAYANNRLETLKPLVSSEVLDAFEKAIEERKVAGQKMEFSLIAINSSKILKKGTQDKPLKVTVEFISEQMNVLRDKTGQVLEGDPIVLSKVLDVWTFERLNKNSKNWVVTATKSEAFNG